MKKILVYGSAPNPQTTVADIAFFSNYSSLQWSEKELESIAPIRHNFISAALVGLEAEVPAKFAANNQLLAQSRWESRVALAPTLLKKKSFQFVKPGFSCLLGQEDINSTLVSVTGRTEPFLDFRHFFRGLLIDPKGFKKRWRNLTGHYLSEIRGGQRPPLNSYFRPSSGVITLLCAIEALGPGNDYFLSGFSFEKRDVHAIWGNDSYGYFTNHVMADRQVLSVLKRFFRVSVLDSPS